MDLSLIRGIIATQGCAQIKFEHGNMFIVTISGTASKQPTTEQEEDIIKQLNKEFKVWFLPLSSTSLKHVYNVRPL